MEQETALPDKYKKEVSEILEGISEGVSKKVTGELKPIVGTTNKKYEGLKSAIKIIENEIISNQEEFVKQLNGHTDKTINIINEHKKYIFKILQAVNKYLPQKTDGLKTEIKKVSNSIEKLQSNFNNNLDNYFKHIEEQQERLFKRSNITFIILGILILINLFINIIL